MYFSDVFLKKDSKENKKEQKKKENKQGAGALLTDCIVHHVRF